MEEEKVEVIVIRGEERHRLQAVRGENLRQLLLRSNLSPYAPLTRRLNCGGRGLCATCGVWISTEASFPPVHWHDRLAARYAYPRLSCQIHVEQPLTIELLTDKLIWGKRRREK